MVRETTQKKRESARVAHSTIISVIMVMYSFISTSSECMLTEIRSCRTEDTVRYISVCVFGYFSAATTQRNPSIFFNLRVILMFVHIFGQDLI